MLWAPTASSVPSPAGRKSSRSDGPRSSCATFSTGSAPSTRSPRVPPGCPGRPLTKRLHELARAGLIAIRPKPDASRVVLRADASRAGRRRGARGHRRLGRELGRGPTGTLRPWSRPVLLVSPLPARRPGSPAALVVRFEFEQSGRRIRSWMLLKDGEGEICNFDPGFGDDLIVTITDPLIFTRWHLGLTSWAEALRSGASRSAARPACVARCRPGTPRPSWPGAAGPHTPIPAVNGRSVAGLVLRHRVRPLAGTPGDTDADHPAGSRTTECGTCSGAPWLTRPTSFASPPRLGASDASTDRPLSRVDDVITTMDHAGLERIHVVGASLGSGVAVEVALSIATAVEANVAPRVRV